MTFAQRIFICLQTVILHSQAREVFSKKLKTPTEKCSQRHTGCLRRRRQQSFTFFPPNSIWLVEVSSAKWMANCLWLLVLDAALCRPYFVRCMKWPACACFVTF